MPQHIRSNKITMPPGETHLTITLELNINITTDGAQATIGNVQTANVKRNDFKEEDNNVFLVPEFHPTPLIEFGEKVVENNES